MQAATAASVSMPSKGKRRKTTSSTPLPVPAEPPPAPRTSKEIASLVKGVEGTIHTTARFYSRGLLPADFEELIAAGRLGAFLAAQRFAADRGANFNTFALRSIRWHVIHEARRIYQHRDQKLLPYDDVLVAHDEGLTIAETHPDESAVDPLAALCEYVDGKIIYAALHTLNLREQHVIRDHYFAGATFAEIGARHGIGASAVQKITAEALRKLRSYIARNSRNR